MNGCTVIERLAVPVDGVVDESVAVTVNELPPVPVAAVGVPEIIPVELSVSPAGSDPAVTANVYGAVPPLAESVCVG